jgi:hypothetical protein
MQIFKNHLHDVELENESIERRNAENAFKKFEHNV